MISSEEFIRLLTAKQYSQKDLQAVTDICRAYPMFNTAHMLKVRILDKLQMDIDSDLKLAGIYAGDRRKFFEFVSPGERVEQQEQIDIENVRVMPDLHFLEEEGLEEPEIVISNDVDKIILTDRELLEIDPAESDSGGEIESIGDPVKEQAEMDEEAEEQPDIVKEKDEESIEDQADEEAEQENNEDEAEKQDDENVEQVVEKKEAEMEEVAEDDIVPVPAIDMIDEDEDEILENEREIEQEIDHLEERVDLIERFINQDPGPIRADSETTLKGDISMDSVRENDQLITDTLAKIYVKQGLHAKAIYAYEKLSLKFPEKSAYFAAQIDKIKNVTNS